MYVDLMVSLRSKDETLASMSKNFEEKEKTIRGQLNHLQSNTKQRQTDYTTDITNLQAEVARKKKENETLIQSVATLTANNTQMTVIHITSSYIYGADYVYCVERSRRDAYGVRK